MLLEIDLKKLEYNFLLIKNTFKTNIIAVLKSNAYGFGINKISKTLYDCGCKNFAINTIEEGKQIRNILGSDVQIIYLNGLREENVLDFIKYRITPAIIDRNELDFYIKKQLNMEFFLFFDSGMNRTGISINDMRSMNINLIQNLNITGVMSHLTNTSFENIDHKQLDVANEIFQTFTNICPRSFLKTSGLLLEDYKYEFLRIGHGLYFDYSPYIGTKDIGRLLGQIIQVRDIKSGDSIGYDNSYIAKQNMKIAVLDVGYDNGLINNMSYIYDMERNNEYKIVGKISMNLTTIDISNYDLLPGSIINIFGKFNRLSSILHCSNGYISTKIKSDRVIYIE